VYVRCLQSHVLVLLVLLLLLVVLVLLLLYIAPTTVNLYQLFETKAESAI